MLYKQGWIRVQSTMLHKQLKKNCIAWLKKHNSGQQTVRQITHYYYYVEGRKYIHGKRDRPKYDKNDWKFAFCFPIITHAW